MCPLAMPALTLCLPREGVPLSKLITALCAARIPLYVYTSESILLTVLRHSYARADVMDNLPSPFIPELHFS